MLVHYISQTKMSKILSASQTAEYKRATPQ